jgi:hypothetical protein
MGRVSTWVHLSIIGGVVSLCPLFVFLIACIIGWVAFLQAQVREPRYLSQRSASVQLYQCDAASSEFGFRFPTLKSSECPRVGQRLINPPERNMTRMMRNGRSA